MSHAMAFSASRRGLALTSLCAVLLAGCGDSPEEMVVSARQYLAKSDLNAASIQLKNALQENGKLAEARYLLGTVNLQQGNLAGAVKELRRAAELGYPAGQVSPQLARAMVQLGEFDQVLKEFAGSKLEDPAANALVLGAVADAHLARKDAAKARAAYEAALQANSGDTRARLGLGRTRLMAGDIDGATADADAVLRATAAAGGSEAAEAYALRADGFMARRQLDEAIAAMSEAVKLRPSEVNYHFVLVSLFLERGDLDAARGRLETMRQQAPAHPLTRYLQAQVEFRANRIAAAREHIVESIQLAPDYLPGRLLAGLIHARLGEHALAQQHLALVVTRVPAHSAARRALAQSQLASGEAARAQETLQPLLEVSAPDAATLKLAAQIHLAKGDITGASESYARVVAARPADAAARTQLGIARLLDGEVAEGLSDLATASDLESSAGEADLALILVHLRRGELDKALAAQRRLESKRPDDPRTYVLEAAILAAKNDRGAARAALEKALAVKADHLPAAMSLAQMDLADTRPQDAIKRFETMVAANPKDIGAHLFLADLLVATGAKPEAVREALERATRENPAVAAPRLALVQFELNQRDTKKALAVAQEVVAAHPNDAKAFEMLGRAQLAAGDQQQAIAAFNKMASLQPQSVVPLLQLADVQRKANDHPGAEQSLRRALSIKADLLDAQQRLVSLYVEDKRPGDAIAIARAVQKQRPKISAGWELEGDIHLLEKDYARALAAFRKALDLRNAPETVIRLYVAQMRGGKAADAAKTVNDWLRAQPKDLTVRAYLADRALAEGRLDEAEKLYRKMNEIKPDIPLVLNNLAWLAGQRKDPQAIALAERALGLAPDNAAFLDTLGVLQVESGQTEKGIENLRRAVSLAPTAWALRMNLARTYAKLGRRDEAIKEADTLLQTLPADSPQRAEVAALKEKL